MQPDMTRCAVHPARPAADECPVCERPRCTADATAAPGGGCLACFGSTATPGRPPVGPRALVGAAATSNVATVVAAAIASDYVDSGVIGYVTPVVLGIIVGIAAEFGAGRARGQAIRAVAVIYAMIGAGLSQILVPGHPSPFSPLGTVWWPYVGAAIGAWLWTVPPRKRAVATAA